MRSDRLPQLRQPSGNRSLEPTMLLSPHYRRMLLKASAIFILSGVGGLVLWPASMSAHHGPYQVANFPLDLTFCEPPGHSMIPENEAHPAPIVRLWYPASADQSRLPLLLYFSGWPGTAIDNPTLVHALAARGFTVASVTYPARLPGLDPAIYKRQLAELTRPMSFASEADFHETLRRADARVRVRAQDAVLVLNMLARLGTCEPANPLARRLDTDRVGIFGFSLGGAVAAQASWLDRRFHAVINMDGWHFADAAKYGVNRPYLWMNDDTPLPGAADLVARDPGRRYTAILNQRDHDSAMDNIRRLGGIIMTVAGSRHADFSDQSGQWLRWFGNLGLIAPRRVQQIVTDYATAFFEATLAGRPPAAIIAGDSAAYPEVHLDIESPRHSASPAIAPGGGPSIHNG
jgi:dienelactone hydrolase